MDRVPFKPVPLNLQFLTDDESLREFARRYWAVYFGESKSFHYAENVGPLAASFGWRLHDVISKLKETVIVTYGNCSECAQPIVFKNRTDLHRNADAMICQTCWDRQRESQRQEREQEYQRNIQEHQRQVAAAPVYTQAELRQIYLDRLTIPAPVDAEKISLEDAVYLAAAFRASQSEYLNFILPLNKTFVQGFQNPVTPGSLFTSEVIDHLHARKLMGIASCSPIEAFTWGADDRPTGCYFEKAIWRIASTPGGGPLVQDVESIFRRAELPDSWRSEVLPLWRKIALHECIEFLKLQLSKHGLPFTPGPKTRMVFEDALTSYSVSQVYNSIYRAAKDAAAYYMEKASTITRHQAANSVVGRIQGFVEYARVQQWDVTRFRRNFDCPRSVLSAVLFDAVLKIGNAGFDEPPRLLEPAVA